MCDDAGTTLTHSSHYHDVNGAHSAPPPLQLVVADVRELKAGEAKLSLITNASGGIIDDTVLTNHGDYIYMVVNGATKHGDMAHFDGHLAAFKAAGGDASYEYLHSQNLVALQGHAAPSVLVALVDGAADKERVRMRRSGVLNVSAAMF